MKYSLLLGLILLFSPILKGQDKQIQAAATTLKVPDVEASMQYYEKLGFRVVEAYGEPVSFSILMRDEQFCFMLVQANVNTQEIGGEVFNAYFWVSDIDALYKEFKGNGAKITQEPTLKDYGGKEMLVVDPNGYLIGFAEIVE